MGKHGWQFVIGAAVVGVAINIFAWLQQTCTQPLVLTAVEGRAAAGCAEFWLNRYQTLIAAILAIAGAWLTIQAMRRQTDAQRGDAADQRLSRYATTFNKMMIALDQVEEANMHKSASEMLRPFDEASDHPILSEALTDGIFGTDTEMIGWFLNNASTFAYSTAHGTNDDGAAHVVFPLFIAISESITMRQELLRRGRSVEDLYVLGLIDTKEVYAAYEERRPPRLFG